MNCIYIYICCLILKSKITLGSEIRKHTSLKPISAQQTVIAVTASQRSYMHSCLDFFVCSFFLLWFNSCKMSIKCDTFHPYCQQMACKMAFGNFRFVASFQVNIVRWFFTWCNWGSDVPSPEDGNACYGRAWVEPLLSHPPYFQLL